MEAAVQPAKQEANAGITHAAVASLDPLDSLMWLPCRLSLEVPVTRFTIGDLLRLTAGSIVETSHACTADVPLVANSIAIGSAEFEVVGERLAVRVTELA